MGLVKLGNVRLAGGDPAGALPAYEESLAIVRKLAMSDPHNVEWQTDLVISLYKISTVSEPPRARAALREALGALDVLARDNRLTAAQKSWPHIMRDALAKLPPEQAQAQ